MLSKLRQFSTHRININFYLRGKLKWEGTLKLLNVLSYFLDEHCEETDNNKTQLKNHSRIRKFVSYFVPENAKCYRAVHSILLCVCLDKVELCLLFNLFLLQLCHLILGILLGWFEMHLEKLSSVDLYAYACTEGNAYKWGSICTDYSN